MTDRQAWIRAIEIAFAIVAIVVGTCLAARLFAGSPAGTGAPLMPETSP